MSIKKLVSMKEFNQLKKSIPSKYEEKLEKYAKSFLQEHFGLDLEIPIKCNGRLKITYGRFRYYGYGKPLSIEMSLDYMAKAILCDKEECIYSVLGHELVHYALFELGKPFDDGDSYFENKLIELGLPSSYAVEKKTENNLFAEILPIIKTSTWQCSTKPDLYAPSTKFHKKTRGMKGFYVGNDKETIFDKLVDTSYVVKN